MQLTLTRYKDTRINSDYIKVHDVDHPFFFVQAANAPRYALRLFCDFNKHIRFKFIEQIESSGVIITRYKQRTNTL